MRLIVSSTEDRVKFFRDEARRDRWLEQVEIKHAEYARVIRSFNQSVLVWTELAGTAEAGGRLGHAAYARREAAKFAKLKSDAEESFKKVGIPVLRNIPEGQVLADVVMLNRKQEQRFFPEVVS